MEPQRKYRTPEQEAEGILFKEFVHGEGEILWRDAVRRDGYKGIAEAVARTIRRRLAAMPLGGWLRDYTDRTNGRIDVIDTLPPRL